MSEEAVRRRRLAELRERLEGGERDNDSAHLRTGIAELHLALGGTERGRTLVHRGGEVP